MSVPLSSNQVTHQLGTELGPLLRAPSRSSLALTSPERFRAGRAGRAGRESAVSVWGSPEARRSALLPFGDSAAGRGSQRRNVCDSSNRAAAAASSSLLGSATNSHEACASPVSPQRGFGPETLSPQRVPSVRGSPDVRLCRNQQQHTPWRPRPPWQDQENQRNNNEEDEMENRRMLHRQNIDDRVEEEEEWGGLGQLTQHHERYHQQQLEQEDLNRHTRETIAARMRVAGGPADAERDAELHVVRPRSRGLQIHRQIAGF